MQTNCPKIVDTIAIIRTNYGQMSFKLFASLTPETVKNFQFHADKGNYNQTVFHRVIKNFMIQGGDIEHKNGYGGYSYKGPNTSFNDEFNPDLRNIRGALAMANSGQNTNGSQFFIVQKNALYLNGKHSVFGQLYEGEKVLDAIANLPTDEMDKPLKDVIIEKIEVKKFQ
ncbi:hypothetical protein A2272_06380 [Candidatus Peregrinibacteria bacterium RIFOXYA12_FULL_33_12]|nr:MAG: hypothetical protein A2263_04600 [Candidatus Peregrinibacteria bacterium RIFOXYA2_FULL_33_21]OGJ47207.1 MAG: hypothetical protein A2272_06380 [Candidatus Peregrinibacteria bacterium RIFOXYA12_FULL_33_12]OGJ49937.1 MAG: hypothetical protein A2307_00775 [Candidatus Peregrinibacteria bacterium RIFOXYB2_FULL_33_20]